MMRVQPSAGGLIFALSISRPPLCPEANTSLPALAFVARYVPQEPARQTTAAVVKKSRRLCRCSLGVLPPRRRRNYSLLSGDDITEEQMSDCGDVGSELPSPTSHKFDVNEEILRRDEASTLIPPPNNSSKRIFSKTKAPNLGAYWEILRPQNVPASFGLVAAGALAASHTTAAVLDPKVLLTAWAAASVAVGSCVLNDWFDLELDRVNKPDRPLVTGEVVPEHALVIGAGFLLGALASAWAVHPAALQATIVASVGLTLAYTPVLKPIPVVKNLVVAGVVGAAIASGGLASGAGITATLSPTLLTFFTIAHREILMDVTDVEGDRAAGILTIPVLLGREVAVGLASVLLTAGVATAAAGALSAADSTDSARRAAAALSLLFASPSYANVFLVMRSGFSPERLSAAVEQALGPLALTLGMMGIALR